MTIRDFIYLDIERVRSFYAQLSKGLPTERTVEKVAEVGLDASVEGNVLFAKGQANTDYRYLRSNTETSSLHDYILEEFMKKLKKNRLLVELPDKKFQWEQTAFQDGMFVLVKGTIKILDYKYVVSSLDNLPKLVKLVGRIVSSTQPQQSSNMSEIEKQLKGMPIGDIAKFIDQNMPDALRVKVYPRHDTPDQHFLATAESTFFRYSTVSLINMYGHVIDANWVCLLQVNRGSQHQLAENARTQPVDGVNIEAALETLADYLTNINKATQGVKFPTIAATPIAIFREI